MMKFNRPATVSRKGQLASFVGRPVGANARTPYPTSARQQQQHNTRGKRKGNRKTGFHPLVVVVLLLLLLQLLLLMMGIHFVLCLIRFVRVIRFVGRARKAFRAQLTLTIFCRDSGSVATVATAAAAAGALYSRLLFSLFKKIFLYISLSFIFNFFPSPLSSIENNI